MVAAGRTLRLSYFDHPGMAWWLSRLAALAAGSEAPLVVRLPFVALFALSTWLMFVLTRRLFGPRAGLWAAVGLNLSPVFSVTTGTWVLPDGPLVCALLAGTYALVRGMEPQKSPLPWWLLAGMCAGLAMLSKYSAVLVLAGLLPALLTQGRWLRRREPYAAALVAALCCAPIVIWNADHGWASFAFQGGRAASHAFHPLGPLATLAGEALFVGLWVWPPMMWAWVRAFRDGPGRAGWLLAWLATPPIVLFAVVSFWAPHVLFHWAAPGYLMLFPLFGTWAERMERLRPSALRLVWRTGAVAAALGWVLLLAEARVNLLAPFGTDPGLQAVDWTELRTQLAQRDLLRPGTVVGGTTWHDTGKLAYGLGPGVPVVCLNPDAREFRFTMPSEPSAGGDVLLIGPTLKTDSVRRAYGGQFQTLTALPPLTLRGTEFPVFLGHSWRG